jgi:hypothetical protein
LKPPQQEGSGAYTLELVMNPAHGIIRISQGRHSLGCGGSGGMPDGGAALGSAAGAPSALIAEDGCSTTAKPMSKKILSLHLLDRAIDRRACLGVWALFLVLQ